MGTPVGQVFPMNGFVTDYATAKEAKPITPESHPPVIGYFTAEQAPVADFFAQNFAICDHWFSCLPAGTQPRPQEKSVYRHCSGSRRTNWL
ncbi:MAG: alkaline phosphatase family protein [Candidatus Binataceae bacterium]